MEARKNVTGTGPSAPAIKAPMRTRINGTGFTVIGKGDADSKSGTYVTNYVFTFFFVPVVIARRYLVLPAPGDELYFLEALPITPTQKLRNILIAPLVTAAFAYLYSVVNR